MKLNENFFNVSVMSRAKFQSIRKTGSEVDESEKLPRLASKTFERIEEFGHGVGQQFVESKLSEEKQ